MGCARSASCGADVWKQRPAELSSRGLIDSARYQGTTHGAAQEGKVIDQNAVGASLQSPKGAVASGNGTNASSSCPVVETDDEIKELFQHTTQFARAIVERH